MPCFMLERGVRIPALMSCHVLSLCVSVRSRVHLAAHSSVHVFFVVLQFVFLSAACFHVVMSCVNTWFMSFLISCVFVSCSAHDW